MLYANVVCGMGWAGRGCDTFSRDVRQELHLLIMMKRSNEMSLGARNSFGWVGY
jgi:hypothetical protein